MGYVLKFTNTVSPPPSPPMSHFGGNGKKKFRANAPTSSPQTSDQVSANVCRPVGHFHRWLGATLSVWALHLQDVFCRWYGCRICFILYFHLSSLTRKKRESRLSQVPSLCSTSSVSECNEFYNESYSSLTHLYHRCTRASRVYSQRYCNLCGLRLTVHYGWEVVSVTFDWREI